MAKKTETPTPSTKEEKQGPEFGTEIFFIEDGDFFDALSGKISDKANVDDFSFKDAALQPGKVRIRMRTEDWEAKTTSKSTFKIRRKNVSGKKGDFTLIDPNGNKLKVTAKTFKAVYAKIIG
jgi:uncharacterized protein YdeI (BOF family)